MKPNWWGRGGLSPAVVGGEGPWVYNQPLKSPTAPHMVRGTWRSVAPRKLGTPTPPQSHRPTIPPSHRPAQGQGDLAERRAEEAGDEVEGDDEGEPELPGALPRHQKRPVVLRPLGNMGHDVRKIRDRRTEKESVWVCEGDAR